MSSFRTQQKVYCCKCISYSIWSP